MAKTKRSLTTGIGNKAYLLRFFDRNWEELTQHTMVSSNLQACMLHIKQWSDLRAKYEGRDEDQVPSLCTAELAQIEVTYE